MVFADLVGSTEMASDLDPEELRGRLAPFFEVARSTLEEHGGTVEKYVGDAVLAVFGVPRVHTDDPDRAVAAALALTERVASMDQGLAVRVGIETGEVLALDGGDDLSVTGEAVNAAARLQQAAAPGEVLIGERAARACRASEVHEAEAVEAKGFPEPLRVWRAKSAGTERMGTSVPFVGRDDDMALLELVYRRAARDRVPELVTITGDAGVGKTRLASELTERLAATDPAPETLLGRNPPYGRGIAFWALGEILRAAAGAGAEDSVASVHDALGERLASLGAEDADELAHSLATALGMKARDGDVEDELKRAWRRLVALLAGERPLVIGIDDAHWADDGLLDLVEEVVFRQDDVPLMVLCTSRPELLERRPDFGRSARNVTQIELRPLTAEAAGELAVALLPDENRALAGRVAQASGGNPFFAEEVAQAIVEGRARRGRSPPRHRAGGDRSAARPTAAAGEAHAPARLGPRAELPRGGARRPDARALRPRPGRPRAEGPRTGAPRDRPREVRLPPPPDPRRRLRRVAREPSVRRSMSVPPTASSAARASAIRSSPSWSPTTGCRRRSSPPPPGTPTPPASRASKRPGSRPAAARHPAPRSCSSRRRSSPPNRRTAPTRCGSQPSSLSIAGAGTRPCGSFRSRPPCRRRSARPARPRAPTRALSRWSRGWAGSPVCSRARSSRRCWSAAATWWPTTTSSRERGWCSTRRGSPGVSGTTRTWRSPRATGLELARQVDDVAVMSSALDASTAVAWSEGRFRDAVAATRERIELLSEAHGGLQLGPERSDSLHMMIESLVATGDYREAAKYATQARDLDLSVGAVYSAWARGLLPAFFLGNWDSATDMAHELREAWAAADRPTIAALAAALACAGAVYGYRGEDAAADDWFRFAESVAPHLGGQVSGVLLLESDVDMHRGCLRDAAERVSRVPEGNFWWRAVYAATRAEALVRAGDERCGEAVTEAEQTIGDHRYARGVLLRARGIREDSEEQLRESLSVFEEIECPYQAARTRWLLGGADRAEAERGFEALGATLPDS